MKRIILFFILTITVVASLSACGQASDEVYMGGSFYIYDNILYFTEHNYLKYTRFDTGETAVLCHDPLCKHDTEDCIAYLPNGFFCHLVVDEAASKNGIALYVSYSYLKNLTDFDQVHGIARIDFAEGNREMFANGLDCSAINQVSIVGDKFYFIATHGPLAKGAKGPAGDVLVEIDKKYNKEGLPTIVLGDMNSRPGDPFHLNMTKYYEDAFIVAEKKCGTVGTFNSAAGSDKNFKLSHRRIDHIYVRSTDKGAIKVKSYEVNRDKAEINGVKVYPSDHNPVIADITIK